MVRQGGRQSVPQFPGPHCLSYSPLPTRLSTVKPAFFASEIETFRGELKLDKTLRTGFLQAGHLVNSGAESGRRKTNLPPHTLQSPSQSSYSYIGMTQKVRNPKSEARRKPEAPSPKTATLPQQFSLQPSFALRPSDFIRHSSFGFPLSLLLFVQPLNKRAE